ncbi:MAG: flagellar basal body L-ring protein FlgH [Betaproteobacteria bacterium]|nr:flagellar basal body L-ring protein FlgH [Betaproteobacteria bacterium]
MRKSRLPALAATLLCAGCAHLGHVEFPPAPAPAAYAAPPAAPPVTGAIFHASTYRPLFEDVRARAAGDTLTIQLVEKTSASRKASSNTNRDSSASLSVGDIVHLPLKGLAGAKASGESGSKFDGKGETASDVLLSGTLTVTVVRVLPNGNLAVAGEKHIGVNRNVERLRLSGVVNPSTILAGNTVASTHVADARIEVSGTGIVNETQTMGWMQRFFLSVWPL